MLYQLFKLCGAKQLHVINEKDVEMIVAYFLPTRVYLEGQPIKHPSQNILSFR
jgi:hypothetical protein